MTKQKLNSLLKKNEVLDSSELQVKLNYRNLLIEKIDGMNHLCIPVSEVQSLESKSSNNFSNNPEIPVVSIVSNKMKIEPEDVYAVTLLPVIKEGLKEMACGLEFRTPKDGELYVTTKVPPTSGTFRVNRCQYRRFFKNMSKQWELRSYVQPRFVINHSNLSYSPSKIQPGVYSQRIIRKMFEAFGNMGGSGPVAEHAWRDMFRRFQPV
jgi:hypothetical protein